MEAITRLEKEIKYFQLEQLVRLRKCLKNPRYKSASHQSIFQTPSRIQNSAIAVSKSTIFGGHIQWLKNLELTGNMLLMWLLSA